MKYSDKLKDPRWQKKRLEIFNRDGWRCLICEESEQTLHIHHVFYNKNEEPWDTPSGFLITVCEECHTNNSCGINCDDCKEYGVNCFGNEAGTNGIRPLISSLLESVYKINTKHNSLLDKFCKARTLISLGGE